MKRLIIILVASFLSMTAGAQIVITTSVNALAGGAGVTTSSFNSTGGSLIIVGEDYRQAQGVSLSDSKTCTWHLIGQYEGIGNQPGSAFYYCDPCVFGSGHTVSTSENFGGICVWVISGSVTGATAIDQYNGNFNGNLSATLAPGSITTTANGDAIFTLCMNWNGSAPTLPSGYAGFNWTTSTSHAGGCAFKIQTSAGAINDTWGNMNVSGIGSAMQISVKAALTASGNSNFFMLNE